jgi:hypothetical protein
MRESRGKAHRVGPGQEARVVEMNERDLMPGDVTIAVDYSTVNADMAQRVSSAAARRRFASAMLIQASLMLIVERPVGD